MSTQTRARSSRSTVLIVHLARTIGHRFEAALTPLGLRQRQVVALNYLRDHGPAPQQALAEALSIDPGNVVLLLNELEDAGLATRRRDHSDRRRHIVDIAPAGREALDAAARVLDGVEDDLLAALTPARRELLNELLDAALDDQLPACAIAISDQR